MKILFYNETLMSGGIEKSIETLIEYLYKDYEIEIVYTDEKKLDMNIVNILKKRAYVHKLDTNQKIVTDICIFCRLYMDYPTLKKSIISNKNILWVHSKPREKENCILDNADFLNDIDKIVCVSDTIKKLLHVDKPAEVIHNFLQSNIEQLSEETIEENIFTNSNNLKLVTVSRLSEGKGFNRVLELVKMLKNNNVDFEYVVIGKGRAKETEIRQMFENIPEVKFIGYNENPYPYIKKADYLVQLSDFETWGNVITESKILNTPVIVTNFDTAYEQVEDDFNGIIIDLFEANYQKYLKRILDNKKILKKNLANFKFKNEISNWKNLFS